MGGFVEIPVARIARPQAPEAWLVRFDHVRASKRFVLQLDEVDAPELGRSERTFACLVVDGVSAYRRGANGSRGCDDEFSRGLDGEANVRDIVLGSSAEARVSLRIELWESLGWIAVEAKTARAYLRGCVIELEPPENEGDAPRHVHRDAMTGEPVDVEAPFDDLLAR